MSTGHVNHCESTLSWSGRKTPLKHPCAAGDNLSYNLDYFQFSEQFCEMAKHYQLTGRSFPELCEHNANVAHGLGAYQVRLLCFLKATYMYMSWQKVPGVAWCMLLVTSSLWPSHWLGQRAQSTSICLVYSGQMFLSLIVVLAWSYYCNLID